MTVQRSFSDRATMRTSVAIPTNDPVAAATPMRVDPRVRTLLAGLELSGWPGLHERTPRQARQDYRILAAATSTWQPVGSAADAVVSTPERDIPVRVYQPRRRTAARPGPLLMWFHGGGFVVGDLFTADGTCRRLVNATGATVVSVHYRRPPEHPLPAAQRDALAATRWALAHVDELGGDSTRLVLAGDSAGGGLAAHVAQRLRDNGPQRAALQVLFYPATDFSLAHTDQDPALAKLLSWDTIHWFATHSMPAGLDRRDPGISPLYATDLAGLPPAVIITAGVDPFRSDAVAYGAALQEAAVSVSHLDFPGQIHGFAGMDLVFPAGRAALRRAATEIGRATPVAAARPAATEPDPIRWVGGLAHHRRRLRDGAQRLPHVNGTYMLTTLIGHRVSSAARALAPQRPGGGSR